jgi:hypothetical protein
MNYSNQKKNYTQLFVEKVQEVDPSIDFLETGKKITLQKFYSKNR